MPSGEVRWTNSIPENYEGEVTISPDGRFVATGGNDGVVRVWDLTTTPPRYRQFHFYDAETGHERFRHLAHRSQANTIAISPKGRWLASAHHTRPAKLWDLATGELVGERGDVRALSVDFRSDGNAMVTAGHDGIQVVRVKDGKIWHTLTKERIYKVVCHPNGESVAGLSADRKSVVLWDVVSGKHIRRLATSADYLYDIAFCPDGRQLAAAARDHTIRLWDVATGWERTLRGHTKPVHSLTFPPHGRTLLSAGDDGTMRLWDLTTGTVEQTIAYIAPTNAQMTIRADGRLLAVGGTDGKVRLWDLTKTPARMRVLKVYQQATSSGPRFTGYLRCIAFTPNGKHLAVANPDGTIYLLDVN